MLKKLIVGAVAVSALIGLTGCATASGDEKVLTVGTEGTYAPFTFHDSSTNELTGYDVEVITAVAKEAGYQVKFEETPWDSIFAGLESGRFDVIANQVTINDDRKAKYTFSEPYTVSSEVAVTRGDNTTFTSISNLSGLTAAQSATSNFRKDAEAAGATIETVPGFTESLALVSAGRVDVTLNDKLAVLDYLKQNPASNLKIAGVFDSTDSQALVFPKNSKLAEPINAALKKLLADGTIAKIGQKYFGEDVTQ
ncbi:MAG: transporter substrate-binding domain-containing protein [Microbacteriaceae bacterium]